MQKSSRIQAAVRIVLMLGNRLDARPTFQCLLAVTFLFLTVEAFAAKAPLVVPARNDVEIKYIDQARAITNDGELRQELDQMIKSLRGGLDAASKDDADRILKKFGGNQTALNNAAAVAWVQSCPGSSLLLAAEAARLDPSNANAANTLAALLVQAGYAHKGIPLLAYLEKRFPDDPTILNNLGQAWFDVGDKDKARPFFARCIVQAPSHGAAHASLGVIAQSEGKAAEAAAHFKTAAEAVSSPAARYELDRSHGSCAVPPGLLGLLRAHEYFNPHHFIPPEPQNELDKAKSKKAELDAFLRLVATNRSLANAIAKESLAKGQQVFMGQMMSPGNGRFGYGGLDTKRLAQPWQEYASLCVDLRPKIENARREIKALADESMAKQSEVDQDFEKTYGKTFGEGAGPAAGNAFKQLCVDKRKIAQYYLVQMSARYEQFVDKTLVPLRVSANDALNCFPLFEPAPLVKPMFYGVVDTYLEGVAKITEVMPIVVGPCDSTPSVESFARTDELPSPMGCPFNLSINLVVVKLNADCSSLGFEFEAGLDFKAVKNFRSGETTLTAGVGADVGVADINGGFVVSWNKDNKLSYIGMEVGASAGVSGIPGLSGTVDTSSVASGTSVSGSTGSLTPDLAKAGMTSTLGVTIGPNGVEPQIGGSAAAEVLGENLFDAKL